MTLVYHGSATLFKNFDYSFIGKNGTSEGIGFYFTDNPDIAIGYAGQEGYIYTAEFKGVKSLSLDKRTISKKELRLLLSHMEDYLYNYGDLIYSSKDKILNMAVNNEYESSESDVDIICGIIHGSGSTKKTLTLLYDVLGYDSIIVDSPEWGGEHKIYIALTHSAYEIKEVKSCKQNTTNN